MNQAKAVEKSVTGEHLVDQGGPLLIAIHGETGSGKSSLAAHFVGELTAELRVVGWLQPGQGERLPNGPASAYGWQPIGADATAIPYLVRDERCQPPFREVEGAATSIDVWVAAEIADARPMDLLVLDEIGGIELAGGGHLQRLQRLLACKPAAVLVVVNTRRLQQVSLLLGQRFDVTINVTQADAMQRLRDVLIARRDFERVGWFGALAGAIEVGAGSVVHGAKLPMGGLGMATTQAAVLTRAAQPMVDRSRVAWVAVLSAAIKSLSPAGQRLRPMLAIVMQGWLYARALRVFGWNLAGVMVGGFLMGVWAGSQGLLTQWLLFGDALTTALQTVNQEATTMLGLPTPRLWVVIATWLALHGGVVATGTALAWRRPLQASTGKGLPGWFVPLSMPKRRRWGAALLHGFRDMLRPTFWVPLLLIIAALAWAGQSRESLIWVALRAMLIAWVMFVLVQRLDLPAMPGKLRQLGMWGPAIAWRRALTRFEADGPG
ncbi:MAG: ATP-binding protein [Pseudomarimonas sp.]